MNCILWKGKEVWLRGGATLGSTPLLHDGARRIQFLDILYTVMLVKLYPFGIMPEVNRHFSLSNTIKALCLSLYNKVNSPISVLITFLQDVLFKT
jgi:hypothetical protein